VSADSIVQSIADLVRNWREIVSSTIHRVTDIKPGVYFIVNKDTNLGLDIQSDNPKAIPEIVCNVRKRIRDQKASDPYVIFA
jgi:hypothetical protein